ncbi:alpha/beta fold hydrolase [Acidovorax sp. SUPP1855]|uniref:esterase/lipase family protein n=1 Tax=Acidovorax sp. SUPP1855 TaxID=431774 RepID=UPI0023DE52C5|nr:alpha/beta fold hydrolase [Acidovorax sp. SUPP1855]GKS83552.1 alpha/beta fold hydrolase [Acidovorax sp. SUPP1855]
MSPTTPSPFHRTWSPAPRRTPWSVLRGLAALCAAAVLCGCAGVTVSSMSPREYLSQRRGDVLTSGRVSEATEEVLRVIGSDADTCADDLADCRNQLAASNGISEEQRLSALAEVWLQVGLEGERDRSAPLPQDEALDAWMESARYAWAYLFFTQRSPGERAFEDRQTQVRDYYNFATQRVVSLLFQRYRAEGRRSDEARTLGAWRISSNASDIRLPSDAPLPEELIPATTLRFSGVRNTYRRDGFGTELVAASVPEPGEQTPAPFKEMPYPAATALLRFPGKTLGEVLRTQEVQVAIYDPYHTARVELGGQQVPLAGNFTAGYGLWLARSGFATQAMRTLLGWSDRLDAPRIHLMQPYDPNRRTIVMLHGLASSPEAWINVANEVLGDAQLRDAYQVWQVYYPTNAPLALNQHDIREALVQTLAHFDPAGTARASRDIVLVGHSMGGVLARLLVSESGDTLWDEVIGRPVLPPEDQARLREDLGPFLVFHPMPQVSRAVFIAAPHRGTPFANKTLSRWLANMVTLPLAVLERFGDATRTLARAQATQPSSGGVPPRLPNSIDNLADTDPFVRAAADLPIGPRVRYHSIMGREDPGTPLAQSSDGIVPYGSAHLAGAESELVLTSHHSVQENPRAILEIRRILREALAAEPVR